MKLAVKKDNDLIIEKLDAVYLKDEATHAYCAFQEFYEYKRSAGKNFSEFIVEHEQRYHKLKQFRMELPEGVRAFFLLKAANMSEDSEKLVRATAELAYDNMREKIMRIFGEPGLQGASGGIPEVKEEVLFGQDQSTGHGRSQGSYRGRNNYRRRSYYQGGRNQGSRGMERNQGSRGMERNQGGRGMERGQSYSGRVPRCYICESTKHLMYNCPHKDEQDEVNMNVHITLLNSKPEVIQKSLILESLGKGLLDSGCSKTVAGCVWVNEFLNAMSPDETKSIKEVPSQSVFRFGDGVEAKSLKRITLPILIGSKGVKIDVEVVDNDIPLLISKAAMKQMGMRLDFRRDMVTLKNGQEVKLMCTSTGHYSLPLSKGTFDLNEVNIVLHLEALENLTRSEKKKKALKLHRQFSHASKERLLRLVKDSEHNDPEFSQCIEEVCDECDTCQKFKKPPLRPVVSLPLADRFNQLVSMDLKEIKASKLWILHLIDAASRYSAACLIKTKKKDVVVAQIFKIWISYFGSPRKFFSDNGGEFANEVLREMNEKLGIETVTTAAESPFSNGICERHNAILFETMAKTMEDTKCEPELALAWAVSAKNALQNKSGFSPNQLAFEYNINLPTVLTDLPPALESTTSSDIVRRNLDAMHKARVNYMKAESSEKIRRALRHKTRTFADEHFVIGEKVFYKRQNLKGWRGPAVVNGFDGKVVLVRHGSAFYRCHPCHLMKVKDPHKGDVVDIVDRNTVKQKNVSNVNVGSKNLGQESSDEEIAEDHTVDQNEDDSSYQESHSDTDNADIEGATDFESSQDTDVDFDDSILPNPDHDEAMSNLCRLFADSFHDSDAELSCGAAPQEIVEASQTESGASSLSGRNKEKPKAKATGPGASNISSTDKERPKANTHVTYKLPSGEWKSATILSKQPKRGGKYGNWMNIHIIGDEKPSSVNWDEIVAWKQLPDQEKIILLTADEEMSQVVVDAKEREIQNLRDNDVFETVEECGQPFVTCKWVITEKMKNGEKVVKARLVARGFEENIHNARTDSPTCSRQSLNIAFATASAMKWILQSLDISSAFLQGNGITRDVFLKPPAEIYEKGVIWKLKRCIYGLKDAPRAWYERVADELQRLGGTRSMYDEAMFLWYDKNMKLEGTLVSHVDDFVYSGTDGWRIRVMDTIMDKFKISEHSKGSFKYIGLNVVQTSTSVYVDQQKYIDGLKEITLSAERMKQKDAQLLPEEKVALRSVSDQLLWASTQTRPDISFDACVVSNYGKEPTIRHIIAANKAIRKLKSTTSKLVFPNLGKPEDLTILAYSDATHASLASGASQGALIIFLSGNGRVAPIMWQSKKLNRITKSPLASETMELAEAADAGFLISAMLQEVYNLPHMPAVECFTDSFSLTEFLKTSHVIQDTRLRVDVARIREMLKFKEIEVKWIRNEIQLADPLTKAGASSAKLLEVLHNAKL